MDTLDIDLLEALLEEVPEYSWEEQEKAPIPRIAPPLAFSYSKARSKAAAASDGEQGYTNNNYNNGGVGGGSASGSGGHTSRAVRKAAIRANKHEQNWDIDTFPFGYEIHFPPPLLTPLQTLRPTDPLPRSSIIVSPYIRIPQYTYCSRSSVNWRRPTPNLRRRCHVSHLPFWGEDGYEDDSEFRGRLRDEIRTSKTRVTFVLPNEQEGTHNGDPHQDREIDILDQIPSDVICGICLAVGCLTHHDAPAVKQPTIDDEDPLKSTLTLSSVSGTSSSTGLSRWRRKSRDRHNSGCGKHCIIHPRRRNESDSEVDYRPFSLWSAAERRELETVLATIGESIVGHSTASCILASYLSNLECWDVAMAIKYDKILDGYTGSNSTGRSSGGGHLPSPGLDVDAEGDTTITDGRGRGKKRRKKDHEDARQEDVQAGNLNIPLIDPTGEFTADELRMRVPRTGLPWAPCYHPGKPCSSFTGKEERKEGQFCSCRYNGTWCEPGCGCPVDCPERFPGCDCAKEGRDCRSGYEDARGRIVNGCPCAEHYRECHIEVCAGHDEKKCKLMSYQDDRAIRTFIATSELEGYGLFVGEDTNQTRVFVGEYKGELVNDNEANYRSCIYQTRQRSFLFDLTKMGIVDGIRIGNKVGYMNTSRHGKNNVLGGTYHINGEARLLIHAQKEGKGKLQKHDELLLDYGANFETF